MAKNNKKDQELLVDVEQSISRAEKYFEENRQSITIIAVAIFVLIGGYFAYEYLYQQPREKEAQQEIFHAQQYFEQDSLKLAVNGDGQHMGFLDVASEYSGTKVGNLSNYYAGISYLRMGQYEKAVSFLDEFETDDPILSVIASGAIGDAFLELNQPKEALSYYKRAVSGSENTFVVPIYLKKAGLVAENQGRLQKAEKYFSRIKEDFKDSQEASDIDKYIARVNAKMKS